MEIGSKSVLSNEILDTRTKISILSEACKNRIYQGFDSDCLGTTKHFDCMDYDQSKIIGMALTADLVNRGLSSRTLKWKGTGELECYEFTPSQVLKLADDMYQHIEDNTDQFNAERLAISDGD